MPLCMYLSNKWKIGVIEQVHVWHASPTVGSCVCMCVCVCVCVCMCVCACVCVSVLSAHGNTSQFSNQMFKNWL